MLKNENQTLPLAKERIKKKMCIRDSNNTPIPFSWNNNFRWKDFDLGITMYGKFHQWKGNDKKTGANPETLLSGGNTLVYVKDQYSYDNLDSQVPSFRFWQHGGVGYGDFFVEKAWYIRIDNITLGYTLPKKWIRGVLSSCLLYTSFGRITDWSRRLYNKTV